MGEALRTRLARLEAAAHTSADPDRAKIERWAYGMCDGNCLRGEILHVARSRAIRRAFAEGRLIPPDLDRPGFELDSDLIRAETDALEARFRESGNVWQALEVWCDEPGALGWPVRSEFDPNDYGTFRERLARGRMLRDQWRDGRHSAAWRAEHPEWRPGMSEAEHDRWELARLAR